MKSLGGKLRKKLRKWIVKCRELARSRIPQSWAGISKRVCKQSKKNTGNTSLWCEVHTGASQEKMIGVNLNARKISISGSRKPGTYRVFICGHEIIQVGDADASRTCGCMVVKHASNLC